jgi:hypothetical protein
MISYLNDVAYELCDFYDITCCYGQKKKLFSFQCENSVDSKIATILKGGCLEYGLEQCDQCAAFMGAYEIFNFIIENLRLVIWLVMRVNIGNILDEELRIRGRGCRMNSKVEDQTNKMKLDAY